jgi:hypothetical protein
VEVNFDLTYVGLTLIWATTSVHVALWLGGIYDSPGDY